MRQRIKDGKTSTETAYDISSLPRHKASAAQLAALIRDHGGRIENGVHRVRDVVPDEDRCTIFRGRSPQNWTSGRNAALNFLRSLKTDSLAKAFRTLTRNSLRLFAILGYVNVKWAAALGCFQWEFKNPEKALSGIDHGWQIDTANSAESTRRQV